MSEIGSSVRRLISPQRPDSESTQAHLRQAGPILLIPAFTRSNEARLRDKFNAAERITRILDNEGIFDQSPDGKPYVFLRQIGTINDHPSPVRLTSSLQLMEGAISRAHPDVQIYKERRLSVDAKKVKRRPEHAYDFLSEAIHANERSLTDAHIDAEHSRTVHAFTMVDYLGSQMFGVQLPYDHLRLNKEHGKVLRLQVGETAVQNVWLQLNESETATPLDTGHSQVPLRTGRFEREAQTAQTESDVGR